MAVVGPKLPKLEKFAHLRGSNSMTTVQAMVMVNNVPTPRHPLMSLF